MASINTESVTFLAEGSENLVGNSGIFVIYKTYPEHLNKEVTKVYNNGSVVSEVVIHGKVNHINELYFKGRMLS